MSSGATENPGDSPDFAPAREIRHGIRRAMGDIETALATAATGRAQLWSSELADRIEVLREAFDHHVELSESPTGFLSGLVDQAPRLAHAADKLRGEHARIAAVIDQCADAARAAGDGSGDVEDARERAIELLQLLARHRQRGADLVYEVYNVDIEGGD